MRRNMLLANILIDSQDKQLRRMSECQMQNIIQLLHSTNYFVSWKQRHKYVQVLNRVERLCLPYMIVPGVVG